MTALLQRPLPLRLAADVALVSLDTAAAHAGLHTDAATELLDGEWPWAFDLSAGHRRVREVRVWAACLTDPARARSARLAEVLTDVIGRAVADVRAAALETRWRVSGQTFLRLHRQGEVRGRLTGHTLWLERRSVEGFLERRLLR